MLSQAPEISETLQWMLQSRQVGDETLVKTLVHEQYTHVYRFVSSIINSKDPSRCEELTEQVIFAALDNANYQGNLSVRAWLSKKTAGVIRDHGESLLKTPKRTKNKQPGAREDNTSLRILDWYAGLTCEMRITITLFYLFEFSKSQIAQVVEIPEARVAEILKVSKEKWLGVKGDTQPPKDFEREIHAALVKRWPEMRIDGRTEVQVSQRILNDLRAKDQRKRRAVNFSEAFLVILVVFLVAGMGGIISMVTPEPTSEIVYETRMVNQIVYVIPTPGPTHPPTPFPEKAILYQAEGGETLAEIAEKTYFNSRILEALNNIPADQPLKAGQEVMIGVSDSRVIMPTPVSSESTPDPIQPTPNAMTLHTNEEDIRQRISSGREYWKTLWADALVIQYGPPGYVGEPELRRQQIWIDQPYFHYLLDGINGGEVEYAYSVIGGWENLLNIQTGERLSNAGPQQSLNFRPDLQQMLFFREFQGGFSGEIEIVRQDLIAGRDVLVLDWYAEEGSMRGGGFENEQERFLHGRYWVDTHLGIVLRVQKYSGNTTNHLFKETIISNVIFNVPIPRRLYDRSQYLQTYFSRDYTGDYVLEPIEIPEKIMAPSQSEEEIQYLTPPSDFEINKSRLTLHWASLSRFNPELGTMVDLFADEYYLGKIEFTEPEQLLCARSSDGYLMAFTSWSQEVDFGHSPLGWFNLNNLPEVHYLNPEIMPFDFAFSPDNKQLAVYGCQREGDQDCGIYIIELDSGEAHLLRAVEQGTELIWSPDGEAIAIQGSFLRNGSWRVLVFDSKSGSVIFDGPFDWEGFWVAHDSPIHDWGVPYPPLRGGLEVCTLPPPRAE